MCVHVGVCLCVCARKGLNAATAVAGWLGWQHEAPDQELHACVPACVQLLTALQIRLKESDDSSICWCVHVPQQLLHHLLLPCAHYCCY